MWEENVIEVEQDWYMLSFGYKWLGERKVHTHALPDFRGYKSNKENDRHLLHKLWEVLDAADIVVAHNGDRFDIRKTNARFIAHGLTPPSPYKTLDTLKLARRHFKFDSNKLDELGKYLGVGRKLPHTGKHLWLGCMRGDLKSWAMMRRYNAHDVELLERVYLRLRPWATSHPQLTHYSRAEACPTCESGNIQYRGFTFSRTGSRQRVRCLDCGAWSVTGNLIRGSSNEIPQAPASRKRPGRKAARQKAKGGNRRRARVHRQSRTARNRARARKA